MSLPPSCVSPEVDLTSNTPSPNSMTVTSNVPPPRSNTRIFSSCACLSRPYASEAAVGSFTMRTTSNPAMVPASLVACRWSSSKYAGTVMTAFPMGSPMNSSASFLIFCKMKAEICCGVYSLPCTAYLWPVPIFRLAPEMVFSGLETACLRAGSPTSSWPSFVKATMLGNALPYAVVPSALGMITGFPPCRTDAAELLVPRSMPIIFSIFLSAIVVHLVVLLSIADVVVLFFVLDVFYVQLFLAFGWLFPPLSLMPEAGSAPCCFSASLRISSTFSKVSTGLGLCVRSR
ncbi:MAG: hypothetical protein QT04_C0004G0011 [archaeon GW2011_AR11]|nr:MAG: hypothetical protein QT04_C0004G0011 [archaeon GW2011_AR11]